MQTRHLCGLIHFRIKGVVGSFKPSSDLDCPFQGDASFEGPFCYF